MTIEEMIKIKQAISLETARMTLEQKRAYYSRGAAELQSKLDDLKTKSKDTEQAAS